VVVAVTWQVDVRADKRKIRAAVQGMYDIQTKKINTLIRCGKQGLVGPLQ
jgi:ribosomal protein L23